MVKLYGKKLFFESFYMLINVSMEAKANFFQTKYPDVNSPT